jgi:hypothetical protein
VLTLGVDVDAPAGADVVGKEVELIFVVDVVDVTDPGVVVVVPTEKVDVLGTAGMVLAVVGNKPVVNKEVELIFVVVVVDATTPGVVVVDAPIGTEDVL